MGLSVLRPATARSPAWGAPEDRAALLAEVIDGLAGKFSTQLLLQHVLRGSLLLLGCDAGSVCTVDETSGVYRKEVDIGVSCQSGRVFPLSERITGAVVAAGAPVLVDDYDQIPGGHLGAADRASLRSAVGIPFTWHGQVVGSCVLFGRASDRNFDYGDTSLLERFASHVGVAIANAGLYRESEERASANAVLAERRRLATELREVVARELTSVGELASTSPAGRALGGRAPGEPAPREEALTPREGEVRSLLELALTDKEIAARLAISTKTVEKHVGAILRKAGLRSRVELVARAGGLVSR